MSRGRYDSPWAWFVVLTTVFFASGWGFALIGIMLWLALV